MVRTHLVVVLTTAAVACGSDRVGPRPEAVEPNTGVEGQSLAVVIRGSFLLAPTVSYRDASESSVDTSVAVRLGGIDLQDATWVDASTVTATVPPTVPAGEHDLTVVMSGREGSRADAFTVKREAHWRLVTVDATALGASCDVPLADFPALISLADPTLRSVANGGHVEHELGYDVAFYERGERLSHEIEQYDAATGALVAWVRIPRLHAGTVLELAYGNDAARSPSEDPARVWNPAFRGVWHLHDDFADSTGNGYDGTSVGSGHAGAWVADGAAFDGQDDHVDIGSPPGLDDLFAGGGTISAWFFADTWGVNGSGWIAGKAGAEGAWGILVGESGSDLVFRKTFEDRDGWWSVPITLAEWYHVEINYSADSAANDPTFYLNGQVVAQTETRTPAGNARSDTAGVMQIGNLGIDAGQGFDGIIDEVRLGKGQSSACWVETEHRNQQQPAELFQVGPERTESCVGFFARRKAIIVPPTGTSLVGFPLLVSIENDADLRSASNGGSVASVAGWDLVFRGDDNQTLAHEIETYDGTTGTLVAWVKVPLISASRTTTVYLYYDNPCISGPSERPTAVWDGNCAGVWHLHSDEADSSGNNHGTAVGTTRVGGQIGNGRAFDGVDDYIYTSVTFWDPQDVTVEAWFKTRTHSGKKIVGFEDARRGEGSTRWDRMVWLGTDGKARFGCSSQPQDRTDVAVSTGRYNDGAWHHIAGVRNDATDTLHLYVDGIEVGVQANAAAMPLAGLWRIGAYKMDGWPAGNDGYFAGAIDEVRVSTSARSAAWIAAEYRNQLDPGAFYAVGPEEAL